MDAKADLSLCCAGSFCRLCRAQAHFFFPPQDSEVNDVLRALDEENERLLTQSKSPQTGYVVS